MRKDLQDDLLQRLRCAEGHTRGVARMLVADADCLEILRQIKAVHGALDKVSQRILEEHLTVCVLDRLRNQDSAQQRRTIRELRGLLTLFERSFQRDLVPPTS